jgi:hypothetical protein
MSNLHACKPAQQTEKALDKTASQCALKRTGRRRQSTVSAVFVLGGIDGVRFWRSGRATVMAPAHSLDRLLKSL